MPQMVDDAGNIWEVDGAGNPVSYVGKQGGQSNTVITKRAGADPLGMAEERRKEQAAVIAQRNADRADHQATVANANSAQANSLAERKFAFDQDRRNAAPLTAKDRADAIVEYNKAIQLRATIDDLVGKFREGPGSTSGVMGIGDYFPTPDNSAFDSAANKLRGSVKAAQGFTGGEGNTMGEVKMNIGPFIPSSWEYDQTTRDKLEELYNQSDNAVQRTVALLGGVPDQYGNVVEQPASKAVRLPFDVDPQQPQEQRQETPAGNLPQQGVDQSAQWLGAPSPNQPGGFVPYGQKYKTVDNPALAGLNARINGMLKAGASREQIAEYMQSMGVNPNDPEIAGGLNAISQFRVKNPQYKGGYNVNLDDMVQPLSGGFMGEQFRNDAPQTKLGVAATTALNAGGMGLPQMMYGDAGFDYLRSQEPEAAFVGDVGGVIGGTSAIGALGRNTIGKALPQLLGGGGKAAFGRQLATDAAYGGIYGATTEGDPLTGALTAGAGSIGGQALGKGLQKTFQGVTDPAVQYLTQRGIPLTIGQTLGNRGMIGKTMNKLESLPVVGDMMAARRVDGLQAFEREALNDVVAPVGGSVRQGGAPGLEQAQDVVGDAYGRALDGVNIPGDPQFIGEAGAALAKGRQIPTMGDQFEYGMQQRIGPLFDGGQLSGREFQAATQNLRKMGAGFRKQGAMGDFADEAVGEMDGALQGLVGRQAPDVLPQFNAANEAFRKLAPFENARIGAINQEAISPAQLARAITTGNKNYGGRAAAARGDQLTDLVKYGQEVLPSTVPDSGTGGRMAAMFLPAALGGSALGAGTLTESPGSAGILAVLAAMSTKTGAKALQKALVSRPDAVRKMGGLFGTGKARQALSGAVTAPWLIE